MRCLTDLTFALAVGLESIFQNQLSTVLKRNFWHSLKSNYPTFKSLPPCLIQHVCKPLCQRLWSLPTMNMSLFVIWVALRLKPYLMLGGHLWIYAQSGLLLGIFGDKLLGGDSICTAELRGLEVQAPYVSCVNKFFTIHQNMGPAQYGNTCWQSTHCKVKQINKVGSHWID